jgi:hypothetical protein
MRPVSAIATQMIEISAIAKETRRPTWLLSTNSAIAGIEVEWMNSAMVKITISIAGSASEAIIISREAPMPPKLVPTSSPASAWRNRAEATEADQCDQVGGGGERQPRREGRHQRRGEPQQREHHVGRGAVEPRRVLRHHRLLAQQLGEVAIGLDDRGPAAREEPRLELAHQPGQRRRQEQHERQLRQLEQDGGRGSDHLTSATVTSSTISAVNMNTR